MGVDYFVCDFCDEANDEYHKYDYGIEHVYGCSCKDSDEYCEDNVSDDAPKDRLNEVRRISKQYFNNEALWCGCKCFGYFPDIDAPLVPNRY